MTRYISTSLLCFALACSVASGAENIEDAPVDFATDILPVLSNKCFVCHGPDSKEEDVVRLDSYAEATKDLGGHQAVNSDSPEESELLVRILSTDDPMPPEDAEKQLTKKERDLMTRWIQQGGKYSQHWSFNPPVKKLPSGSQEISPNKAIDAFIEADLKKKGIDFAVEADRAILARRTALVLTGLPPSPELLSNLLADNSEAAYLHFVDELLTSPRYGEHQARYWLDAVRYGDTHGLHLDNKRGIYPYRDWIIQALNQNLPMDDFITWQVAGDLLPNPTLQQRVATGFVRMNPSTSEGGAIPAEFQAKNNFDRVETMGTVFLGMTLTCARCHTHKYDPIPQTEYYRLMAFFNSTAESSMDGNKYEYGPVVKAPASVSAWHQWSSLGSEQAKLLSAAKALLQKNGDDQSKWNAADAKAKLALAANPKGPFTDTEIHKQAVALSKRITEAEKQFTTTLVAQDLAKPRTTQVLARGEYNLPTGDPLEPGILAAIGAFPKDAPRNRLGLSQWLTARENPLVARVMINRVWQRTFGQALVRTPEDFGLQGQQPTHPKLLDWLAVELHDSNWDLKHMLRLMVTSRAFRQSSAWREGVADPDNRLLARGPSHRLDAEVIRDITLWSSGLLDQHMGGEGVKPYQPKGLWSALMHPASNTKLYVPDQDEKQYRRSVYVYWKRTSPHPMMTLFDAPSREASCVRRSRTNTSLQSLGLLNETQRTEMARKLAERILSGAKSDSERFDLLFNILASRKPTTGERIACMQLFHSMKKRYAASEEDAVALLSIGNSPRDETLNSAEYAAWSQLAITVLASDVAISLY
ncbi:MAG: PSD1 and planctomycete cytochrome C domain-containing protein [Pirellulales bacterium]